MNHWKKNEANVKICANLPFFDRDIFRIYNGEYSSVDGTEVCQSDGRETGESVFAEGEVMIMISR